MLRRLRRSGERPVVSEMPTVPVQVTDDDSRRAKRNDHGSIRQTGDTRRNVEGQPQSQERAEVGVVELVRRRCCRSLQSSTSQLPQTVLDVSKSLDTESLQAQ